jgi:predicted ATPase
LAGLIEIDPGPRLLAATRRLTLVVPPGVGKTRLAIEGAQVVSEAFADGVHFVPLAPLSDASLVLSAIAQRLGLSESEGRSLRDLIVASLQGKTVLLIFDNCEQAIAAATQVLDLVGACPRLRAIVTSRSPLRVRGEQLFPAAHRMAPPAKPVKSAGKSWRREAKHPEIRDAVTVQYLPSPPLPETVAKE